MVLLLDVGNTIIKAALLTEGLIQEVFNLGLNDHQSIDELLRKYPKLQLCFMSAVRELPEPISKSLSEKMIVRMLSSEMSMPFTLAYKTSETLGTDRIAAVAAAWEMYPAENVLVIDMGSCITYDFLNADGVYYGGAISPGIEMRFKAMHTFTARLPLVSAVGAANLIGETTIASLQSGVMNGVQAELDGIIEQYEARYQPLKILVGGGDNKYFDKKFKINIFATSNLVLEGLRVILNYNRFG